MNIAFLSLGSNLGNREENLKKCIKLLSDNNKIKVIKVSSFYETPPVGYTEQGKFLNGVIKISTDFSSNELLLFLQNIEKSVGRKKTFKWGPRVIDIDILFFNNEIISTEHLKIPHPYLHERAFVLVPFVEIEESWVHPVLNKKIIELHNNLPENEIKSIRKWNLQNDF
jgi:2-amino-4-hydroxy-6-hydroxymethyldihydropteridine diphosphokinase